MFASSSTGLARKHKHLHRRLPRHHDLPYDRLSYCFRDLPDLDLYASRRMNTALRIFVSPAHGLASRYNFFSLLCIYSLSTCCTHTAAWGFWCNNYIPPIVIRFFLSSFVHLKVIDFTVCLPTMVVSRYVESNSRPVSLLETLFISRGELEHRVCVLYDVWAEVKHERTRLRHTK